MAKIIKKIFFPFYNEQHKFLFSKWWFRAVVVVYIGAMILSMPYTWFWSVNDSYQRCSEERKEFYGDGTPEYYESLMLCNEVARERWFSPVTIQDTIFVPVISHYLLQFVFFKIGIDFVALGSKANKNFGE